MGAIFGREKRSLQPTFFEPPIPPVFGGGFGFFGEPDGAGQMEGALQVPTVWACVQSLANAVSLTPLETFRSRGGVDERATDAPLLVSPAAGMTQSEWLHMLMVSVLLRGNAYGKITKRDAFQRPTQIELLNPDQVKVDVDRDSGAVSYRIGRDLTPFPTHNMWHFRGMTMPGAKVGLSPVAYAAAVIGVDLGSRKFAGDFFEGGGVPKAILSGGTGAQAQAYTREQARTIKDRFLEAARNREPVVMGSGATYQQISVSPEESQFLATQQANVSQIARFFGVPPELVGGSSGGSLTYANVEQRQIDFLTLGVAWWFKRIEDALFPLLPGPNFVRFNTEAFLRTDAETQARVDNQRIAGKQLTPTEVRARSLHLPPMTQAQKEEVGLVPLEPTPLGGVKSVAGPSTPSTPVVNDEGGPDAPA